MTCRSLLLLTKSAHSRTAVGFFERNLSCFGPSLHLYPKAASNDNFKSVGSINFKRFQHQGSLGSRPYVDSKLSYAYGRSTDHLIYTTVANELVRQVSETPDEIIYTFHNERKHVTYREFNHDVNKLSKAMVQKFDIKKGDYVGVFAYNCYNWLLIELACSRIGAILTPINPSNKTNELAYILKKGKVKCLFLHGPKSVQSELNNHFGVLQSDEIVELSKHGDLLLRDVVLMDTDCEYTLSPGGGQDSLVNKLSNCLVHNWSATQNDGQIFESLQEAESLGLSSQSSSPCVIDPDLVSPDDVFAVYYTSGTTGRPKGACISNFTVINNVKACQSRLRLGFSPESKTIVVTILPMFHIFAGVLTALSPLVSNSRIVFANYKYDIKAIVDSIIDNQANVVTLTPTILIDMLSYIETNKLKDIPLRIVQSGGAALQPEVVARTMKVLPNLQEVRNGYGSTENGAVATMQNLHEPAEVKASTVGPPIDLTEVRIVQPNTDNVVLLGERGEIQTRGHNVMLGYLDDPDKTKEVITANRWYRTGDIGIMHKHGSIQINGRLKHMIIKGGENIYPEEVEQLIHKLDYVEDVHVVGVPDERFGEQVCAWIKLKPGYSEEKSDANRATDPNKIHRDDILDYCKENITYFKVPKYLIFVDEFPMTPTKKVQNHIMIEQSCKILGLKVA